MAQGRGLVRPALAANPSGPGSAPRRGLGNARAAAAICVVIAGLYAQTGFGYAFDFALAIVFAAVLIPLVMLAVALLLTIARKLPRMATE